MARRRRFQWIDSITSGYVALAGAVAPGTIVNSAIITEAELENVGGGATLIRVVGDIITQEVVGVPVVTHTLFIQQAFAGAGFPADWDGDTFQRADVLGTWMHGPCSNTLFTVHERIDLRTKLKLGQGIELDLASQNHSVATNDAIFIFHLRFLLMLP